MFNYHCTVLKQNSVYHNVAWRQRLLSRLSKEKYQPEGDGTYTNAAGESFGIEETDVAFKLSSTCQPSDKIMRAVNSIYNFESSGMDVDVGLVMREVGTVAAIAAGFLTLVLGATFTKGVKKVFTRTNAEAHEIAEIANKANGAFSVESTEELFRAVQRDTLKALDNGADVTSALQTSLYGKLASARFDRVTAQSRILSNLDVVSMTKYVPQSPEGLETLFNNLKSQMIKESIEGAKETLDIAIAANAAYDIEKQASEVFFNLLEPELKGGAMVGGAVVGGSAIISVLKNLKHKRPCVGTSNGTRVALRIPTRCSPKELELLMKNINLLDLGGVAAVTDPETCTIRVVPKLDKLSQYYLSLDVTDGVMEIQSWLQKGNGDTRKEKDFPSGLVPSKQVGNKIFDAMLSKFLVEPEFTEANRGVVISINPDIEEIPQCISTNA